MCEVTDLKKTEKKSRFLQNIFSRRFTVVKMPTVKPFFQNFLLDNRLSESIHFQQSLHFLRFIFHMLQWEGQICAEKVRGSNPGMDNIFYISYRKLNQKSTYYTPFIKSTKSTGSGFESHYKLCFVELYTKKIYQSTIFFKHQNQLRPLVFSAVRVATTLTIACYILKKPIAFYYPLRFWFQILKTYSPVS